jgi:hypothetical protein
MVAMFLVVVGHGVGNRMIQERFQHSGETVSRHFHDVLFACLSLSMKYIKPQDPLFRNSHAKIRGDPRYWPFFKNVIGAIDGTHIPCVVSASDQTRFIGRKGYPTQNVMAVCDWDMCFTFVLAGWEGTVHDARVFDQALTNANLNFPHPPPGINIILYNFFFIILLIFLILFSIRHVLFGGCWLSNTNGVSWSI